MNTNPAVFALITEGINDPLDKFSPMSKEFGTSGACNDWSPDAGAMPAALTSALASNSLAEARGCAPPPWEPPVSGLSHSRCCRYF